MAETRLDSDDSVQITWRAWLMQHELMNIFARKEGQHEPYDDLIWRPMAPDREAAWSLYTELRTRIATQPLAYRSGDEESALDSIYRLFDLSRSIIKQCKGCTHFASLTVRILNTRIRPFTAKWHRVRVDGRLSSADVRFDFRRELAALQPLLRTFTRLLGLLANDKTLTELEDHENSSGSQPSALWDPLPFGISTKRTRFEGATAINEKEREEVFGRRALYELGALSATDAIGLAISGGGIRSATFSLGVIQHLAQRGILEEVDFLSTVSGGGYLGAFITSFLSGENERVDLNPKAGNLPFGAVRDAESQGIRHLRNHSKYLSEGGFQTVVTLIGMAIHGVFVSIMLLAPWLLMGVAVAEFWRKQFVSQPAGFPSNYALWCLVVLGVSVLLLPLAQKTTRKLWSFWQNICIVLGLICAVLLIGEMLPHLFHATTLSHPFLPLMITLIFPLTLSALGLWLGPRTLAGRIVFGLFGIAGPLLGIAGFLCTTYLFMVKWPDSRFWLTGIMLALFFYGAFILNINFASPHQYYRDRLARTYLIQQSETKDEVVMHDPQLLSTMNHTRKAPYHLINAALNIPKCDDPNLRGRNSDFFLFTKHFCGSPIIGFQPTSDWEQMDAHLDLGTAMAISGAAAAPHMGMLTAPQFTFLLAMLNIRLGYWLRNPGKPPRIRAIQRLLPPVGWYYFLLELSGQMTGKTRFVNLTDGGHIENLGVYELLRRRCKFIIAVDGEADPARSFGGLLKLTQLAKIDLGVQIEPDLADLRLDRDGFGRAHFGLSRLDYPDGAHGLLLYIKSSLTGNESELLKKYRAENPDFPHQSTANQLFSETQFEAYRSLGQHIAEDLFRSDLVEDWDNDLTVREWFKRLADRLLA